MSNIPTAKEFLAERGIYGTANEERMIEFANLHLKAAIEAIIGQLDSKININSGIPYVTHYEVKSRSEIRNAYPLTNIK